MKENNQFKATTDKEIDELIKRISQAPDFLRAEDRLNESIFFLNKLSHEKAWSNSGRYFLNSFIISVRSVSLVLKKDLTAKYGDQFKIWWENKINVAPEYVKKFFNRIRNVRNILEKEGAHTPKYVYGKKIDTKSVQYWFYIVSDASKNYLGRRPIVSITKFKIKFTGDHMEVMKKILVTTAKETNMDMLHNSEFKFIGFYFDNDDNFSAEKIVRPSVFEKEIKNYIKWLKHTVYEAKKKFPMSNWVHDNELLNL